MCWIKCRVEMGEETNKLELDYRERMSEYRIHKQININNKNMEETRE